MTLRAPVSVHAPRPARARARTANAPAALRPTLAVDLTAIATNTRRLAEATTGALMAVVKADGFGHGAVTVAQTALAHGAQALGVTGLADAVALREAGLRAPMLAWLHPVDEEFGPAVTHDIQVAVPSLAHLDRVARTAPGAAVHLQVDVGMARDGCAVRDWRRLFSHARTLERSGHVRVVGLMGHLPCADDPREPSNAQGRVRFLSALQLARACGLRPPQRHLAATEGTLRDPLSHHTMSRCGAGLVGVAGGLRPAATLTAPVIEVRRVRAGTPVGYGHAWTAARDTTLALLPLGYADGLPRVAGRRATVLVHGARRPLAGRISMDMTVVDAGDLMVRPGDPVTLFGPGDHGEPTVGDWAGWARTLPHEIVTGIGTRVVRTPALRTVG